MKKFPGERNKKLFLRSCAREAYLWTLKRITKYINPTADPSELILHKTGEFISDEIRRLGMFYESRQLLTCSALLPRPKNFFDIGSNIGNHSVWFKSLGAKIFAIEPSKRNFEILTENLRANFVAPLGGGGAGINAAIGDAEGFVELITYPSSMGNSHINGAWNDNTKSERGFETVRCTSRDILLRSGEISKPLDGDLVKIDVEGSELMVLSGGKNFFSDTSPFLWLEIHDDLIYSAARAKQTQAKLFKILKEYGFKYRLYLSGTDLVFSKKRKPFFRKF